SWSEMLSLQGAVLDMDAFSVSFVYNGDHVKSPKGAQGNTSVVEPVQQKESPKFNERCCSKKGTSY
ncbi:hypothetical protein Tco_0379748, partial [Tanacetum coccineum]